MSCRAAGSGPVRAVSSLAATFGRAAAPDGASLGLRWSSSASGNGSSKGGRKDGASDPLAEIVAPSAGQSKPVRVSAKRESVAAIRDDRDLLTTGWEGADVESEGGEPRSPFRPRKVGALGLDAVQRGSYPGSSVPFEPQGVGQPRAQGLWAAIGSRDSSAEGDLPPEEIIATPYDHPVYTAAANSEDYAHRYPEFTSEDVRKAFAERMKRAEAIRSRAIEERWGISLEEQKEMTTMEAKVHSDLEASRKARGETQEESFQTALLRQVRPEEQSDFYKTRSEVLQALIDQEEQDTQHEDPSDLAIKEERAHALYQRRIGRFVDAVYGSGVRDSDDESLNVSVASRRVCVQSTIDSVAGSSLVGSGPPDGRVWVAPHVHPQPLWVGESLGGG
jgi:hypothetical protein